MSAHDLSIPQIVMSLDEAVAKRLKSGVSNRSQSGCRKIGDGSLQQGLIDSYPSNVAVPPVVIAVVKSRKKIQQAPPVESQEQLAAGDIAQDTVGLPSVPMLAEYSRNMSAPRLQRTQKRL